MSARKETIRDLAELTSLFLRSNVVSLKQLETYAGKSLHVASLFWMWRINHP